MLVIKRDKKEQEKEKGGKYKTAKKKKQITEREDKNNDYIT